MIVAAGALVTPQLLMLSGIGPADQLAAHGIACIVDLPGVGENLIDHPEVPIVAMANGPYGYYRQGVGWRMLRNGLQFKLFGTGPITLVRRRGGRLRQSRTTPRPSRRSRPSACRSSISTAIRSAWSRTPTA